MKKSFLFFFLLLFHSLQILAQDEPVWNLNIDSGVNGINVHSSSFQQVHDSLLPATEIIRPKTKFPGKWYYPFVFRVAIAKDTSKGIKVEVIEYRNWKRWMTWSGEMPPEIFIIKGSFSNGLRIGESKIEDLCALYPDASVLEFEGFKFVRYGTCVFRFDADGKLDKVKVSRSLCLFL